MGRDLPPPSLAEADLPRFLSRVAGRRRADELATVAIALREGAWPAQAAVALDALAEVIEARELDPAALDPEGIDRLMASPDGLSCLEARTRLDRTLLRPGTIVSPEVSSRVRGQVRVLFGVGPHLVLVAPVEVVGLDGVGWSAPRSEALARPMDGVESEALLEAWAVVEEHASWPEGPDAALWEARFVRASSRSNLPLGSLATALRPIEPARRRGLWALFVDHHRSRSLADAHRPHPSALAQAVAGAGFELPRAQPEAFGALDAMAGQALAACARDPRAAVRCSRADLETFSSWIEVPLSTRERLAAMEPAVVEHVLRALEAREAGVVDVALDPERDRDVRALRDGFLRPRYGRRDGHLLGVDPLSLAEAELEAGEGRGAALRALREVAESVRAASPLPLQARDKSATDPAAPPGPLPTPPEVAPVMTLERARKRLRPRTGAGEEALSPLPKPPAQARPPRRRPRTAPPGALPPLPSLPEESSRPSKTRPRTRPLTKSFEPPSALEAAGPPPSAPRTKLPAPPAERPRATSHLVTPAQATRFYESVFRELEVLERDLLERGPWADAARRVKALGQEAGELADALGPPARSGDPAFSGALHKIGVVQAYLERLRAILAGEGPRPELELDTPPGVLGRLGRLWRREDEPEV